jgi:hypothetical protein
MRLPDSSWFFSNITSLSTGNIPLSHNSPKSYYVVPYGHQMQISFLPNYSTQQLSLTTVNDGQFTPSSLSLATVTGNSTTITASGNTTYSLQGTNTYGDAFNIASTNIISNTNPVFNFYSANSLGNTPNSPLQINYQSSSASNVSITSNMRSISIPSTALSGSLTVNNPQNGEILTLTATDPVTGQISQIKLTVDNSNKIFSCIPPSEDGVAGGTRSIFVGSGEITISPSPDSQSLYFGRALSTPAILYLKPNLLEYYNEVSNLILKGYNFFADGTPCILASDQSNLYVCQPAAGKVSIFDYSTQSVSSELVGTRPTNIEVNDDYIVIKDGNKLSIYNKALILLSQFPLEYKLVEANDREIFISSDKIFFLDGSKIKIIDQSNLTTISKIIDLGPTYTILSGALVYSSILNKIFIMGLHQEDITGITHTTTGPTFAAYLWVYDLTNDDLEIVNRIDTPIRGDVRFGLRLDIDQTRLFALGDWLNSVYSISTKAEDNYKILEKWNTLKPFGLGLQWDGKYLYYSGQDENSINLNTQRSRHLVIMRLFETKFNIEVS